MAWILTLPHIKYSDKWNIIVCLIFDCSMIWYIPRYFLWFCFIYQWCRYKIDLIWWCSMIILIYVVWCCALDNLIYLMMRCFLCDDKNFYVVTNVSAWYVYGNEMKYFDQLHSWIVAYQTSRMPGDSPITSNKVFLVLQFVSYFRIWGYFEIEHLICLKLCIHSGGGPSTCLFRSCGWGTNSRSFRCVVWVFSYWPWWVSIPYYFGHVQYCLQFTFEYCYFFYCFNHVTWYGA